jgi:hypothetical protein
MITARQNSADGREKSSSHWISNRPVTSAPSVLLLPFESGPAPP